MVGLGGGEWLGISAHGEVNCELRAPKGEGVVEGQGGGAGVGARSMHPQLTLGRLLSIALPEICALVRCPADGGSSPTLAPVVSPAFEITPSSCVCPEQRLRWE